MGHPVRLGIAFGLLALLPSWGWTQDGFATPPWSAKSAATAPRANPSILSSGAPTSFASGSPVSAPIEQIMQPGFATLDSAPPPEKKQSFWERCSLPGDRLAFLSFPYANEVGFMAYPAEGSPVETHHWLFRSERSLLYSLTDSEYRFRSRVLIEHQSRWGFQVSYLTRPFETNTSEFGGQLFDFNLMYRIAQRENFLARVGAGTRMAIDQGNTMFGTNVTMGFDWFPVKPLVVSSSLDIGSLQKDLVFSGRFTVGANWRRFEFLAGYEYTRIGHADLHGPMIGVRLWKTR